MFKKKIIKLRTILCFLTFSLITAVFIVGDVIANKYSGLITTALGGATTDFSGDDFERASALGDQTTIDIQEEGIVLLKNGDIAGNIKSLPLAEDIKKVNVFGWGSTQFLQKGVGSGSSSINAEKSVNLLQALDEFLGGTESDHAYNVRLADAYRAFSTADITAKNDSNDYKLYQPTLAWHEDKLTYAKSFSSTALVVISRVGGENIGEIPTKQTLVTENGTSEDTSRTYLQLTKHEDDLINMCHENFSNVILIINNTNTMHLNVLESDKVDSCICVGITGQSGAKAIPHILWGYKKDKNNNKVLLSPSGKNSDTYVYDPTTSPSFANKEPNDNHIQYLEDIYYGYKWYETADTEGYWDSVNNEYGTGYDGVVQFPFGFGMSYTSFEWKDVTYQVSHLDANNKLQADSEITINVTVKNIGGYPGKDVVELYLNPSYKDGEIEKSSAVLVGFAKTKTLAPQDEQIVTIKTKAYDFASYDAFDRNGNDFYGYEVDYAKDGKYILNLKTDSHRKKEGLADIILEVPTAGIKYSQDPVTGEVVKNRMTTVNGKSTAYLGVPIDGSTVNASQNYLRRNAFATLFPTQHAPTPSGTGGAENQSNSSYNTTVMLNDNPVDNGLRIVTHKDEEHTSASYSELNGESKVALEANLGLMRTLTDYDSEQWDSLLDQITHTEMKNLVEYGGFRTLAMESVGKPVASDNDGPAGFNENTKGIVNENTNKWTAYPSETVIGTTWSEELCLKMGLCMGLEAQVTAVQGWYAPGVNIHRTAYTARNYEYYSEDPVLSGILAGNVIQGAKINGLYCYLKHFVLSEEGPNPRNINTWITEQNLRENYLKPFEIAVKYYGANAIMSAFNRVGSVWAGASYPCLTEILRNEWGFKGSVITDYADPNNATLGKMNPVQGVKAGNDLWLNPAGIDKFGTSGLDMSDPTTVACARRATKNILFTYIDTYVYGSDFNVETLPAELLPYKANIEIKVSDAAEAWWIPVLISVESVIMASLLVWMFFSIRGVILRRKAYYAAHPEEIVIKEKKPFYITERLRKVFMFIALGATGVSLLLVTLIPLFNDILGTKQQSGGQVIQNPVLDPGPPFDTIIEFEDGKVKGRSVGEDHLCITKSYGIESFYRGSTALKELQKGSTVTYTFDSDKALYTVMDIVLESIYNEDKNKYLDTSLSEVISLNTNGEDINLTDFIVKGEDEEVDNIMRTVKNIPVTIFKGKNTFTFTIKKNCPPLDYFDIRTSAYITNIESAISGKYNYEVYISTTPTTEEAGRLTLECRDACENKATYLLPALSVANGYKYNGDLQTYSRTVMGKPFTISTSSSGPAGAVSSTPNETKLFNGENFYEKSEWNRAYNNATSKDDSYKYTNANIINQFGEIVLDANNIGRRSLLFANKNKQNPATDFSNADNKGYLGSTLRYSLDITTSKGFTLGAFGLSFFSQDYKANNARPGFYFTLGDDDRIGLTIGVNNDGHPEVNAFKTPVNFVYASNVGFRYGKKNKVELEILRKTPAELILGLYINGNLVSFPNMATTASIGDIANRYTEGGKIHIIQSSSVKYAWGDYISFAPSAPLSVGGLEYSLEV